MPQVFPLFLLWGLQAPEHFGDTPHDTGGGADPDLLVGAVILHGHIGLILVFKGFKAHGNSAHGRARKGSVQRRILIALPVHGAHGEGIKAKYIFQLPHGQIEELPVMVEAGQVKDIFGLTEQCCVKAPELISHGKAP